MYYTFIQQIITYCWALPVIFATFEIYFCS